MWNHERVYKKNFYICTVQYDSQKPPMATEQLKCGYQIGQYRSRVHLYANKDNPIERKKFMMQERDGSLRSQEIQSTRGGTNL